MRSLRVALTGAVAASLLLLSPGLSAWAAAAEVVSGEGRAAGPAQVVTGRSIVQPGAIPSVDVRGLSDVPGIPTVASEGVPLQAAGLPASSARPAGAAFAAPGSPRADAPSSEAPLVAPAAEQAAPELALIGQPKAGAESSAGAGAALETVLQGGPASSEGSDQAVPAGYGVMSARLSGLGRTRPRAEAPRAVETPAPRSLETELRATVSRWAERPAVRRVWSALRGPLALVLYPVLFPFIAHEAAHARAAYRLGDPRPVLDNRGSLKPRDLWSHFDPLWSGVIPAVSLLSQHFIVGGAKPVEFDSSQFRKTGPVVGSALAGFAGPAVNIVLAGLGALAFAGLGGLAATGAAAALLSALSYAVGVFTVGNAALAVFNLMPFYPLDGHFIVNALLPKSWARKLDDFHEHGGVLAWAPLAAFMAVLIKFGLGAMAVSWLATLLLGGPAAATLHLASAALPAVAAAGVMIGQMRDARTPVLPEPVDLIVRLDSAKPALVADSHISWATAQDYSATLDAMSLQLARAGLDSVALASFGARPVATYSRINTATIRVDAARADALRAWLRAQGHEVFENGRRRIIEPVPDVPEDADPSSRGAVTMDEVLTITRADAVQAEARRRWGDPDQGTGLLGRILNRVIRAAVPQPPIAVVDSGAWTDHPRLKKGVKRVVNATSGENKDDIGHGTWVTSMVLNFAKWLTNLTHYKTFVDGGASTDDILKALTMAANDGNIVISNSWGDDSGDPSSPDSQLVRKLAEEGHVLVFAAGNAGPGADTIGAPAIVTYKDAKTGAIRVVSVASTNRDKQTSYFSSRGDYSPKTKDDPKGVEPRPDLAAVGQNVEGAWPDYLGALYKAISGTSMSTPDVAGAIALLCMMFGVTTKGAPLDAVVKAVMDTLENTGAAHAEQGGGFLNVEAAYRELGKTLRPVKLGWAARAALRLSSRPTGGR